MTYCAVRFFIRYLFFHIHFTSEREREEGKRERDYTPDIMQWRAASRVIYNMRKTYRRFARHEKRMFTTHQRADRINLIAMWRITNETGMTNYSAQPWIVVVMRDRLSYVIDERSIRMTVISILVCDFNKFNSWNFSHFLFLFMISLDTMFSYLSLCHDMYVNREK